MKSTKKTKTKVKKSPSDELRKPAKMVPAKEKDKNSWKNHAVDDFEDIDEQVMDDNFKGFDDLADHEDDEDEF